MEVLNVEEPVIAVRVSQYPEDKKNEFLCLGRSNVGKSSFINTIVNRKNIARTSSKPGKTTTLNFYQVNKEFYIVDVPGYGVEFTFLVPVSVEALLGRVPEEEALHVVSLAEFLVKSVEILFCGSYVACGRNNLDEHVLNVPGLVLTEHFLVILIVLLYLGRGNLYGGVTHISERNHHEVHVSGGVVLLYRPGEHERVYIGTVDEEGEVLVIVLLVAYQVDKIVPSLRILGDETLYLGLVRE